MTENHLDAIWRVAEYRCGGDSTGLMSDQRLKIIGCVAGRLLCETADGRKIAIEPAKLRLI